jgi:hypothetical protein
VLDEKQIEICEVRGVGDAPVGGIGLPVDAVPGAAGDLGGGYPGV